MIGQLLHSLTPVRRRLQPLGPKRAPRAIRPDSKLARIRNLQDFETAVHDRLPRAVYTYVASGSEDGVTLRRNRDAFLDWRFETRILTDVAERDPQVDLFGRAYAAPFGIAPMGGSAVVAYDADLAMARAAAALRVPFVLSANSITPMEEVARAAPGAWFAAYQDPDPAKVAAMVARVARAGFAVLVLTADVPVGSNREADARRGFRQPIRPTPQLAWDAATHPGWLLGTLVHTFAKRGLPRIDNLEPEGGPHLFSGGVSSIAAHDRLSWRHVDLIRRLWDGPLVIKGVLSPEDAARARASGADGIIVSNHGGRQLDHSATPLDVLRTIRAKAQDMTVMIDSGFRRGTDVLTSLALGARLAFVGRPFLFAAALAGEAGVKHAISLLAQEIDTDMALLGLHNLQELREDMLIAVRAQQSFVGPRDRGP